jgi:hypothetical protein
MNSREYSNFDKKMVPLFGVEGRKSPAVVDLSFRFRV